MKVFVSGATGVLGRTVTRLLLDGGHDVRALARSAENESRIRTAGAEPVRGGLFDSASLKAAVQGCDAILHLATHIPPSSEMPKRKAWHENDRIRAEGTRNLVDAALESGVSTIIYPGIVFVYPDRGENWMDATVVPAPTGLLKSSLDAEAHIERFTKAGGRGIVLRMGNFYGPASQNTQDMLRIARHGIALIFGRSNAYLPLIWIDDAALAVYDSLMQAAAGIYDIVDDEPMRRKDLSRALAESLGRRWLLRLPSILLWMLLGRNMMFLARSQRVSNRKFKDTTTWAPTVPSAKLGFRLLSIPP
jgi:nucleoside-diphosphate-sugar epimerase